MHCRRHAFVCFTFFRRAAAALSSYFHLLQPATKHRNPTLQNMHAKEALAFALMCLLLAHEDNAEHAAQSAAMRVPKECTRARHCAYVQLVALHPLAQHSAKTSNANSSRVGWGFLTGKRCPCVRGRGKKSPRSSSDAEDRGCTQWMGYGMQLLRKDQQPERGMSARVLLLRSKISAYLVEPLHKHQHMTCSLRFNARPQQRIGGFELAPAAQFFAVIWVEIVSRESRGAESPSARDET